MVIPAYSSFDYVNNIAIFKLYIVDMFITTYTFTNNEMLLAETTNPIINTLEGVKINILTIDKFIAEIKRYFNGNNEKRSKFTEEIKKKVDILEGTFKLGTTKISEIEFNPSTLQVTFQPRTEMTLKFIDFVAWREFIKRFIGEASKF